MMPSKKVLISCAILLIGVFLGSIPDEVNAQIKGGYIQGTVRDAVTNSPIPNITIRGYEVNFGTKCTGGTSYHTDANGNFNAWCPQGVLKILFNRGSTAYIPQYWNNAYTYSTAAPITLADGATKTGINAFLQSGMGGRIAGKVSDSGGSGISSVVVTVYDEAFVNNWDALASGTTNSIGEYLIDYLPPGKFKLNFRTSSNSNYAQKWYDDKALINDANPVAVTSGGITVVNVVLLEGGKVAGVVKNESNAGVANAQVLVYSQEKKIISTGGTASDGSYEANRLPTGVYKVLINRPSGSTLTYQWYNNKNTYSEADWVPVTLGNTTSGINAQLKLGGGVDGITSSGTMQGQTNLQGPLSSAWINAYDADGLSVSSTSSNPDGTFSIKGLPTGFYRIRFYANNYGAIWYNNKRSFESADPILVNEGETVSGKDGQLFADSQISGKVYDPQGVGIAKVKVKVLENDHQGLIGETTTDGLGEFDLRQLPPGGVKILYDTTGTGYLSEWYDNRKTEESAIVLNLLSGGTYPSRDAQLDLGLYLPLILR